DCREPRRRGAAAAGLGARARRVVLRHDVLARADAVPALGARTWRRRYGRWHRHAGGAGRRIFRTLARGAPRHEAGHRGPPAVPRTFVGFGMVRGLCDKKIACPGPQPVLMPPHSVPAKWLPGLPGYSSRALLPLTT